MRGEIKEKGEDKYIIRIFLGRDSTGRRSYHYETFHGKKRLAENRKNDLLSLYSKGLLTKPEKLSLIDYLDTWVNGSVKETIARRTHSDYQSMIERYVKPHKLARIKLTNLTADHLEALYKDILDRNLSVRTVRYLHNILKRALKQAERRGKVQRNVANLVELPKQKQRKIPRSLNFDQVEKFLQAASKDKFHAIWMLALDSGMRPEEYLALEWNDIDFKTKIVKVERVLCWNRKGGGYYFDDTKTEVSRRTIELAPSTIEVLREHRRTQNEQKMRSGKEWKVALYEKKALHLVFTTDLGTPLLLSNLHRRHFKPILKNANLPKEFRVYDLRHTCATLLGVMNVRPKLIQERLGHSTIKTTLDLYSHVLNSEKSIASGMLEETIFSRLGK